MNQIWPSVDQQTNSSVFQAFSGRVTCSGQVAEDEDVSLRGLLPGSFVVENDPLTVVVGGPLVLSNGWGE